MPATALTLGFLPISRRRLTAFAALHGVTVTTANGPVLIRYLTRSVRWRSTGGALGWLAGAAIAPPTGALFGGAIGYLAGAFAAELHSSVRRAPGPRRALLVKRHSKDYMSWGVQWGPVLVLAVLVLQGLGELLWRREAGA
ncbi:hypothetical protein ACQPYK_13395 [Streptosporangium sp. CA-135522]|uniref:hypothetical protein n=1 Tax=Streptosporangium sp. CA-135522 TaxID=3240072 RepID=UPI003D93B57D